MQRTLLPLFAAVLGLGLAAACTNDFGQYNFGGEGGVGLVLVGGTGGTGGTGGGTGGLGGGEGGSPPGECQTDEDCGTDTVCRQTVCSSMNQCLEFTTNQGTDCTLPNNQAGFCDGIGNCVECINGTQCPSGVCDTFFNMCEDPSCVDTVLNGAETDVDCGGGMCMGCANMLMCGNGADCLSGFCNAGTCEACTVDADCADVANTWCDTGVCVPQKNPGDPCAGANECLSGFCPADDSVCCDVACDGVCESCLAADTAQAMDGTCDAVTMGTDPKGECNNVDTLCEGDFCSGTAGQCEPAANTVTCRMAAGPCDIPELCDGTNLGCPAVDVKEPNTTVCGPAMGLCDLPELCDGTNDACPTDQVAPLNTICRAGAPNSCDATELCDGVSPMCPTDLQLPVNTPCRPVAGDCDVAELCDGVAFTCPVDGFLGDNVVSNGDACNPYLCDGMMAGCPMSCVGSEDCVSGLTCVGTTCQ